MRGGSTREARRETGRKKPKKKAMSDRDGRERQSCLVKQ
jgi:hypothetical protein